jgi:ABC-type antimicrobial peptide transport system permease subunit
MRVVPSAQRPEIGIRIALGADRGSILRSIFRRAFAQLAVGVMLGLAAAALLDIAIDGELMGGHAAIILPAVSLLMIAVGLAATFEPARRGLRISPTEALKAE